MDSNPLTYVPLLEHKSEPELVTFLYRQGTMSTRKPSSDFDQGFGNNPGDWQQL